MPSSQGVAYPGCLKPTSVAWCKWAAAKRPGEALGLLEHWVTDAGSL